MLIDSVAPARLEMAAPQPVVATIPSTGCARGTDWLAVGVFAVPGPAQAVMSATPKSNTCLVPARPRYLAGVKTAAARIGSTRAQPPFRLTAEFQVPRRARGGSVRKRAARPGGCPTR